MQVNLNWIKDYVDWEGDVDSDGLLDLIARRLGEIESVVDLADKYRSIEVVRVAGVEPFPDHDRIRVAKLETGQGPQTVICGAANLEAGCWALWLPVGGAVPATWSSSKPAVLDAKEIGGVVSQGMLLSPAELDWGSDHDGIVMLGDESRAPFWAEGQSLDEPKVGQSMVDYFDLGLVVDIENKMFTHRPDCFGLLGVAREIAGITGQPFRSPNWYRLAETKESTTDPEVVIDCPDYVNRFQITRLKNMTVKPSALEVLSRLSSVGIKPVNNLADITNYMMYLSGQPTHVFDWQALGQPTKIGVRRSRPTDRLDLLNGQTLVPTKDQPATLVVADDRPVALGGIMGGQDTAVGDQTSEVILECANFDMHDIWRATMNYGLFTPAATRFTKGQSPHQIEPVGRRTAELLALVSGGEVTGVRDGLAKELSLPKLVRVRPEFINDRLGTNLDNDKIRSVLAGAELQSEVDSEGQLLVEVPFWRTDLEIAEDIVEEVGRLAGYENIEPVLPNRSISPPRVNPQMRFGQRLRQILAGAGANEVMGYSFVGANLLESAGQLPANSFEVKNPLRPDLQFYRQSLTPTVAALMSQSQRTATPPLALFELGYCHWLGGPADDEGLPLDQPRLSLVYLGDKTQSVRPFYSVRRYLDLLANALGVNFDYRPVVAGDLEANWLTPYQVNKAATVCLNDQPLGVIGSLEGQLAGFEIDPLVLNQQADLATSKYQPLSRYPASRQDLTLRLDAGVLYADLWVCLKAVLAASDYQSQLTLLSIWSPPDQNNTKHISWRLELTSHEQTLETAAVSAVIDRLVEAAGREFKASLVT